MNLDGSTVHVLLMADPGTGNDPLEATLALPIVPRKGDTIEIWTRRESPGSANGGPVHVEVEQVNLCAWAPERIEVWVRLDGYDLEELESAFAAIKAGGQP